MIHKIVKLQNVGSYEKCCPPYEGWDGVFSKINLLFGQNRSGKTTLSIVFKSLSGNNQLLKKKVRFGVAEPPFVSIVDSEKKIFSFDGTKWNSHIKAIKVFDIHFIEDNLYTGYAQTTQNGESLFEIIVGKKGVELKAKLNEKAAIRRANRRERSTLKRLLSKLAKDQDQSAKATINEQIKEIDKQYRENFNETKSLDIELGKYSQGVFVHHIAKINEYLNLFAPGILIQKISKNPRNYVTFTLKVHGNDVYMRSTAEGKYEAKYVLSEGDRNAIAFAFFLAQLEIEGDIDSSIIVFDDPISSFDYSRKLLTINHLFRLSLKCQQIFILSHDLQFFKSLHDKFSVRGKADIRQIQISNDGKRSKFSLFDCDTESLTGIFKDLVTIESFLKNGAATDFEKREVKRCIRPILEGYMRIKFFGEFDKTEWLGGMIDRIRSASANSPLSSAKLNLNLLEDLNDYSKEIHHSNPAYPEEPINTNELELMAKNLKNVLLNL